MPFATFLANEMLDHTYGQGAFAAPTAWWAQLHYGDPGTNCTANAWTAAGRVAVSDFTDPVTGNGITKNAADITWTNIPNPATGQETITHVSIHSAASSGSAYGYGAVATARYCDAGDTLTVPAQSLTIQLL